ncbi:vitellogenesis-inhibiting hormone-like [Hyalella azteca]|uniref:Vitellogenesis-inhibiting hormone-like n=1 Tax=Hyalella azteca TaxID=294128 RepID=A0A8B7PAR9_HYAAZ|nr:vitellogenesis-inhibiting hormone-like [Hyalella azteca]
MLGLAALLLWGLDCVDGEQVRGVRARWFTQYEDCFSLIGNRDIYDEVSEICYDCQNLFRQSDVEDKCRANCFWNEYFVLCVHALQLWSRIPQYKLTANILKVG